MVKRRVNGDMVVGITYEKFLGSIDISESGKLWRHQ